MSRIHVFQNYKHAMKNLFVCMLFVGVLTRADGSQQMALLSFPEFVDVKEL